MKPTTNTRRIGMFFFLCLLGLLATETRAQDPPKRRPQLGNFPDLVGGLKAVQGCIGVETARTATGKNVIFAWFENKEAVLRWYHSEMHQGVMKSLAGGYSSKTPLQGVPDDIGPVMAIASITFAEKSQFEGLALPISQISIELYQPITGGIFLGGRFAPDSLKVKGLRDLTPTGD
jgi:hypothetical protein